MPHRSDSPQRRPRRPRWTSAYRWNSILRKVLGEHLHRMFLQKVIGESSPGEIIAQLAAIDEAEDRFTALRAAT